MIARPGRLRAAVRRAGLGIAAAQALLLSLPVGADPVPVDLRQFAAGRALLQRYLGADSLRVVARGSVVVYARPDWGSEAVATSAAAAAALPALRAALALPANDATPVWIVIASGGGALSREAPEWTAGVARPGERLIVLSGPAMRSARAGLETTVAHELVHLLLHQRIGEQGWVPRWFDEGLAVQLSGAVGWRDRLATFGRGPVHLRELTDVFPAEARSARFAYLESAAAVRRLLDRGSLAPLLDRVAAGDDFDVAFAAAFGEPVAVFADRVHAEVGRRMRWLAALGGGVTLGGVMTFLAVVAVVRTRQRNRRRAREWAQAEAFPVIVPEPDAGAAVSTTAVPPAREP